MTKTRHVLAVSGNSPYHRLLKFIDGVPSVVTDFPAQSSPVGLNKVATTPDGKYFLASSAASSTTPFRMWKRAADNTFTTVAVAALSLAGTITELFFLTDTHVIAVDSTNGVWLGVLDRATDIITWTRVDTVAGWTGGCKLTAAGDFFMVVRPTAAPYLRIFKRTGDTVSTTTGLTGVGPSFSVTSVSTDMTTGDIIMARGGTPGTAVFGYFSIDWATMTILFASASQQMEAPAAGATATLMAHAWSPSGKHLVYSTDNAADFYLRMETLTNRNPRPTRRYRGDATAISPAIPATLVDIKFVDSTLFLVSVNSNVQGSGRVRGFLHDDSSEQVTEVNAISDCFDDWSAIISSIAVGPEIVSNAKVSLYNSAPHSLIAETVDLANLKLALVTSSAAFDATHTTLAAALGANEVYGSSWPQGGIDTDTATWADTGTGSQYALNINVPSLDLQAAGTLTFRAAILYDNTDAGKKPLAYIDYGADQVAPQFKRMQFSFPGGRLFVTETAN